MRVVLEASEPWSSPWGHLGTPEQRCFKLGLNVEVMDLGQKEHSYCTSWLQTLPHTCPPFVLVASCLPVNRTASA